MKKTSYSFKNFPFHDQLSVYDNYMYLARKRKLDDAEIMDFEEFAEKHCNENFYSVANKYGVYE